MKLVFDIGMYDGSDTEYYLSEGFRVVAVEANPSLVEKARGKFDEQLSSGQLTLVNSAICNEPGQEVSLSVCGDDLGSSSIFEERISQRNPVGSYKVKGVTLLELMEQYGQPYFIKVDIEGADGFCIYPLNAHNRPQYISFETGDEIEAFISHLKNIGFSRFKAINQCNFNELSNQESLPFRIKRKIIYLLGYSTPRYVRRNGRFFCLMHSAGPAPWASDGKWQHADDLLKKWKSAAARNELRGWYDVHAM